MAKTRRRAANGPRHKLEPKYGKRGTARHHYKNSAEAKARKA